MLRSHTKLCHPYGGQQLNLSFFSSLGCWTSAVFLCSSVVNQEFEQFNCRSWYFLSLSLLGLFLLHSLLALVIPSKSFLLFFKLVRLLISVWGLANQIAVGACLQVNKKNGVTEPVPFHSSKSKLLWFCLILVSFQCFLIESWLLYFIQNLMLSVKCYRSITRGKTLLNTFTHKFMLLLYTTYYLMFCCEHPSYFTFLLT